MLQCYTHSVYACMCETCVCAHMHNAFRDLCSSCRNRRCWTEEGGYSGGSDDDEDSHNRLRKTPQHYTANQVFANLVIHGDIEFKMDQNSYRMVPLSNCEDYMYRGGALGRAKPVSPALHH